MLPPNSTYLLQQLDLCFFRPLKIAWRNVLRDWKKYTLDTLSIDAFPSLQTLNKISAYQHKNIRKVFQATGLIPFDPESVLSKLPYHEDDKEESCTNWSSSFEEILKYARYSTTSKARVRRRRVNLSPGTRCKRKGTDGQQEAEITALEEDIEVVNEVLPPSEEQPGDEQKILMRQYVWVVTAVGAKDVKVKLLWPFCNSHWVFIFLIVDDENRVPKEQVAKVLKKPQEEKWRFILK